MNKADLVTTAAEISGLTKADVDKVIDAVFDIPSLRHDPKFSRVYDAKIVGYSIAESVPLDRDVVAQEAEDSVAEGAIGRVALVVGDGLVHRAP